MKRNTYHLSAALALLLGLAACTQDELSSPSGGVEGAAMTFTATGLNSAPAPVPPWTATGRACRAWQL